MCLWHHEEDVLKGSALIDKAISSGVHGKLLIHYLMSSQCCAFMSSMFYGIETYDIIYVYLVHAEISWFINPLSQKSTDFVFEGWIFLHLEKRRELNSIHKEMTEDSRLIFHRKDLLLKCCYQAGQQYIQLCKKQKKQKPS